MPVVIYYAHQVYMSLSKLDELNNDINIPINQFSVIAVGGRQILLFKFVKLFNLFVFVLFYLFIYFFGGGVVFSYVSFFCFELWFVFLFLIFFLSKVPLKVNQFDIVCYEDGSGKLTMCMLNDD